MDQSELNAAVQRWLESLLQPPSENQIKPLPATNIQEPLDLTVVLDKLKQILKLDELPKTSLRAGGTHLAILARSVAAYLYVALDSQDVDRAARQLSLQTTKALMTMFKLTGKKLTPYYHDDPKEALVRVMQMALFAKYDKYAIDGCREFYDKAPVFYISDSGYISQCYNACGKFGIPQSSISLVPCGPLPASTNAMNVEALETAISEDISKGRCPVMVIAQAGTSITGHVEDMRKIRELCDRYSLWMHVQGHAFSSLCLPNEDKHVAACREGDSLALCPGTWFGLLSCPSLTLHKTPYVIDTDEIENLEEFPPKDVTIPDGCVPIPRYNWAGMLPSGLSRLLPLSLWLCLQYLGTNTLIETVSYCHNLTQHMISKLDEIPGLRRFDIPTHQSFVVLFKYFGGGEVEFTPLVAPPTPLLIAPPTSEGTETADGSLPVEVAEDGEKSQPVELTTPPDDDSPSTGSQAAPVIEQGLEESEAPPTLYIEELEGPTCNVANAMIARDLQAHFLKVGISPLKLPHQGVCFRFDPINSFPEHSTSIEDMDRFFAALQHRVESLHTTSLARKLMETQLKGLPNLRCLEFPSFFGSGFIQYVPTDWADKVELTLEEVSELNSLNMELSTVLAEKNPVFTSFQHGNFSCIMIKELAAETNLQEFVLDLLEETKMFEENKKFLRGMSEKIIQGIQAAQSDIHKEKEQKEQEESLLRSIPLVGSVWSWFSPPAPATPQGRQFNLSSGQVRSTEGTYRYKMQVRDGTALPEDPSMSSQSNSPEKLKQDSSTEETPAAAVTESPESDKLPADQQTDGN